MGKADLNLDPMSVMVCPVTDMGCESWTVACTDALSPIDYDIMRNLQDPKNAEAAREIGRLCWGTESACGIDLMTQLKAELAMRGEF